MVGVTPAGHLEIAESRHIDIPLFSCARGMVSDSSICKSRGQANIAAAVACRMDRRP